MAGKRSTMSNDTEKGLSIQLLRIHLDSKRFRERGYLEHAPFPGSGRFSVTVTGSCALLRYEGASAQDLGLGP